MTNWQMFLNLQEQVNRGLNGVTQKDVDDLKTQFGKMLNTHDEYTGPLKADLTMPRILKRVCEDYDLTTK